MPGIILWQEEGSQRLNCLVASSGETQKGWVFGAPNLNIGKTQCPKMVSLACMVVSGASHARVFEPPGGRAQVGY